MKRSLVAFAFAAIVTLGLGAGASAAPNNYPTNLNACVGTSLTTANTAFQSTDPDKFRSDQARADDGQPGRAEAVAVIPQCQQAGLSRGVVK